MIPAVSVIIAAYNAERFLHRAIASVAEQSMKDLEIIVIDDASIDDTANVAAALAARFPMVRVLRLTENGGPSAARNLGLDNAQGDWVAVLDADDTFEPAHLETLLASTQQHEADIVLANISFFNPTSGSLTGSGLSPSGDADPIGIATYIDHARPLTGEVDWGLLKPMIRRRFLDDAKIRYPLFSRHGEDFLLIADALLHGAVTVISRPATYRYTERISGWSTTQVDYTAQVAQSEALLKDPRLIGKPDAARALMDRMTALNRWSAKLKVESWREYRDYWAIFTSFFSDRNIRSELKRLSTSKMQYILHKKIKRYIQLFL